MKTEEIAIDLFLYLFCSLNFIKIILFIYILNFYISSVNSAGIGCFVCSSFNGSNPDCEDTFNSTVERGAKGNIANYQFPCWAFKKNRQGLFPADHCIKVSGYKSNDPTQTIVIRTCALDSGTLTADTEIVRISHCGHFKYEGSQYTGCVQACDTDGCNKISANYNFTNMLIAFATIFSFRLFIHLFF
uniref:Protein quiver n=1 Tax=Panagrolaimus sp. PS1159 TaxID=55785 RepID=A0AC35F6S3_9BILA